MKLREVKTVTRTLKIGPGLWFNATFNEDGNIVAMEEHDWREGGGINIPEGVDANEFFYDRVADRTESTESRAEACLFIEEGYVLKNRKEPTLAEQNGILYQIRQKYGIAADTDGYKMTHAPLYVRNATKMISYIESRGGKFDEILFFGLQLLLKEYFLQRLTHAHVDAIVAFEKLYFMDNYTEDLEIALRAVVDDYEGKLPIKIRAAEEGLIIPVKNVLITVENTVEDSRIFTLVSYFETKLVRVWSPTTVATTSYEIRKIIYEGLKRTAMDPDMEILYKLVDFGSRGVPDMGTAMFTGAGHLVSFEASDTVVAVMGMNIAYQAEMAAYAIPASEHSTTTMHGRQGERQLIRQMFDAAAKPGAQFATVIDSYNWMTFINEIAVEFKEELIASGATWIFRPDSGHSVKTPIEVVKQLGEVFGYTVNKKGFKVLNNVRVLQGDGIDIDDVRAIVVGLIEDGWSISNIAFGMGGGLLQKNDRDTQKFAMKCCAVLIEDEWHDVFKSPAVFNPNTWEVDPAASSFKKSKAGRLELMYNTQTDSYKTIEVTQADEQEGMFGWTKALHTVYEDGFLVKELTLEQVRRNAGIID